MKSLSKTLLAVLATGVLSCAIFSQQAQATALNGDIQFAGETHFDTNSLATATRVVTWFDVFHNAGHSSVTSGTGDFAGIAPGTQATMAQPWIFIPSTPTPGLWSVGGFSFDPTAMDWSFTTQSAGGHTRTTFSFSANGQTVPDGGTTVMLLGAALGVLGM